VDIQLCIDYDIKKVSHHSLFSLEEVQHMETAEQSLSLRRILFSLVSLLDFTEQDILSSITHHGRRTAYTALHTGRKLGLNEQELFDLTAYSLLHDIGIIEHQYPPSNMQTDRLVLERDPNHCESGQRILSSFYFLTPLDHVILYHHEYEDGSGIYGKKGDEIPLFSRIIAMADYLDTRLYRKGTPGEVRNSVSELAGVTFPKQIVSAFIAASETETFWEDLMPENITYALERTMPRLDTQLSLKEFIRTAETISAMVDGKSPFTSTHISGIASRALQFAEASGFSQEHSRMFYIAALLHDVGKLIIPNRILEKEAPLNEEEFILIRRHPYYTEKAMHQMGLDPKIIAWARNHHERLDGSGYPNGLSSVELDFESRVIAVLDIYQSLIEDRPYRKALSHAEAVEILKDLGAQQKIDRDIIGMLEKLMG